jgi:hypothetical protein
MDDALQAGLLDPAAILAVHAVIAACDAFTIRHLGKQSASGNHFDVTDLITRVKNVQGLAEAARHPRRLLQEKGSIEYSDRYPRREEAERLAEHARRFVGFVEKNLE